MGDVVEHILVLLKDSKKLQREEYLALMEKMDNVRTERLERCS